MYKSLPGLLSIDYYYLTVTESLDSTIVQNLDYDEYNAQTHAHGIKDVFTGVQGGGGIFFLYAESKVFY